MKKTLFLAVALFVSLLFTAGISSAATLCLDMVGHCNDIKLKVPAIKAPGAYAIRGYEYGCGHTDREIFGTLRATGTGGMDKWYIGYTKTGTYNMQVYANTVIITYTPGSNSGTYLGNYLYSDSGSDSSGTFEKVACPAGSAPVVIDGPDETDR
jgi:hypothetical protein